MHIFIFLMSFLATSAWAQEIKVLTLYHSPNEETLKVAKSIAQGASELSNVTSVLKSIKDIEPEELAQYDAIAIGSPIYFGAMSAEMKSFLDRTLELWKKKSLAQKPITVFLSAGSGAGRDLAIMNIWSTLASHGALIVPLGPDGGSTPFGTVSSADSDPKKIAELARKQGHLLAEVASKLKEKIALPPAPNPVGNYRPYKISGKLIYINQIALEDGKIRNPGVIGKNVSEEEAKLATRQATLNVLAVLKSAVGGDLSKIKQAVQLTGYFNTTPQYKDHSLLMNESSDLLIKLLGDKGIHARAAVGAPSLPMNSPIEIQAIFEMH